VRAIVRPVVTKSRRRRAAELEAELEGADRGSSLEDDEQSRSARKRESHELRDLGVELVALRPERLAALDLPSFLLDAVNDARRLRSFGAQRRQAQYIGKLMRQLDDEVLTAIRKAVAAARQ
jgi:ribosome-associated protein